MHQTNKYISQICRYLPFAQPTHGASELLARVGCRCGREKGNSNPYDLSSSFRQLSEFFATLIGGQYSVDRCFAETAGFECMQRRCRRSAG